MRIYWGHTHTHTHTHSHTHTHVHVCYPAHVHGCVLICMCVIKNPLYNPKVWVLLLVVCIFVNVHVCVLGTHLVCMAMNGKSGVKLGNCIEQMPMVMTLGSIYITHMHRVTHIQKACKCTHTETHTQTHRQTHTKRETQKETHGHSSNVHGNGW